MTARAPAPRDITRPRDDPSRSSGAGSGRRGAGERPARLVIPRAPTVCRKNISPDFPIARALDRGFAEWPGTRTANRESSFERGAAPPSHPLAAAAVVSIPRDVRDAHGERAERERTSIREVLNNTANAATTGTAPPLASRLSLCRTSSALVSARPPCISATRPPPTRPARTRLAPRATGKTRIAPRCADNNPGGTSPPAKTRPGRSPLS